MTAAFQSRLNRAQLVALAAGLAGMAASAAGAFVNSKQFFFSYLFALLFWLGLSLGCLMAAMIHQLTGGRWGYPTRRFLEAGFMALPLMLLLFIPVFLGLRELYPWAQPLEVAAHHELLRRSVYENDWAYAARQVFFLLLWIVLCARLRRWSLQQDRMKDAAPTRKARALSGPGLVIYGLLGTFASVDWIMSLEKAWYSTMFGVIVIIGQILSAFAFAVIMLTLFKNQPPLAQVVNKTHFHHLGNLLLTFVLFWTYISFGQLLVIYSGDLPHELEWYLHRISGGWKLVIAAVALFHFFLPFFLLLFRRVKRSVAALTGLAATLFIMRLADTYWLVMPAYHQHGLAVSWMDFTEPIGIGGLWFSYFLWRLKSAPLLPLNDPGLQFSFVYGD